jgi:zinc protease
MSIPLNNLSPVATTRRIALMPMSRLATVVTLLGLAGFAAADASKPVPFPYKEIVLDNGLRVLSLEDPGSGVVAVHLWYHVGSKDEQAGRQGFAHMFEHMMFRGTDRLGPEDHFKQIRRTGGSCNAYTAFDQTVYVQELPANQLELALWLEAERMGFLRVDQAGYDTERKVVEEERRLGLNRPYGTIPEKGLAELFPGQAYGWSPIGNIAHLRAAAVGELRDFWQRYYVPNNATLVVAGGVKHEDVQRLAKKYFGWMPRDAEPARVAPSPAGAFKSRSITLKDDNAPAPAVGLVWRTVPAGHDDSVPLQLLSTILGGGTSSRLYRELVAEKQLAVVAQAANITFENAGLFGAGAAMAPLSKNGPQVIEAIRRQVEQLRTEPVTEKELLKAKNQMLAELASQSRTAARQARALGEAAVIEHDPARINLQFDRIRAITAADLQRVAKTYLGPDAAINATIEQNLLGSLMGHKPSAEETSPITAKPETGPAPKVKAGLVRPADFPPTPPIAAGVVTPPKPESTQFTLPNGLKVIVVPKRGVPFVSATLALLNGAGLESQAGSASLALQMLTKGSANHTEKALSEELETYAINLGGTADMDSASVSASSLTEHLPRAMTLLAEVVRTPTFPADELEKLRKQTLASLAISERQPASKAEREFRKRLFGDHPYGRAATGEAADVKAVTVGDVTRWWKRFAFADHAVLLFAGDIDAATARKLATEAFGDWQWKNFVDDPHLRSVPDPNPTHIYLVDQPGAIQSQIRIGQGSFKRNDPKYAVARVVGDYFGGAFSSRLNEVIRVQKGLTYGASGGYSPARFEGRFVVSTFSKTESTAAALTAALSEIDRLRVEPPTDNELSETKAHFVGSVALQRETPQQVANELWSAELYGLPPDHFEQTLAQAAAVTPAECVALAKATIDPTKLVIVVVGDASKLKESLEKIAPVTVVK